MSLTYPFLVSFSLSCLFASFPLVIIPDVFETIWNVLTASRFPGCILIKNRMQTVHFYRWFKHHSLIVYFIVVEFNLMPQILTQKLLLVYLSCSCTSVVSDNFPYYFQALFSSKFFQIPLRQWKIYDQLSCLWMKENATKIVFRDSRPRKLITHWDKPLG